MYVHCTRKADVSLLSLHNDQTLARWTVVASLRSFPAAPSGYTLVRVSPRFYFFFSAHARPRPRTMCCSLCCNKMSLFDKCILPENCSKPLLLSGVALLVALYCLQTYVLLSCCYSISCRDGTVGNRTLLLGY
jgi:hypothetical protein